MDGERKRCPLSRKGRELALIALEVLLKDPEVHRIFLKGQKPLPLAEGNL
jgi:hypothetical protein